MTYDRILRALVSEPWAIQEEKLYAICELLLLKANGGNVPDFKAVDRPETRRQRTIGILPLFGVVAHRANMVSDFSGGTSLQKFGRELTMMANDADIDNIIIEVDSPGGSVAGVQEAADIIRAAARQKPVYAIANAFSASAAYWLASQASELWSTPSGQVGSIGVLAVHRDISQRLENEGIKTTFITAGKYKAEASQEMPLTDEARDYMQERVNEYYAEFVSAVAKGRGVSDKFVADNFGQGRMMTTKAALDVGMIDRVGTMDDLIRAIVASPQGPGIRAEAGLTEADEKRRQKWASEEIS